MLQQAELDAVDYGEGWNEDELQADLEMQAEARAQAEAHDEDNGDDDGGAEAEVEVEGEGEAAPEDTGIEAGSTQQEVGHAPEVPETTDEQLFPSLPTPPRSRGRWVSGRWVSGRWVSLETSDRTAVSVSEVTSSQIRCYYKPVKSETQRLSIT